MNPYASIPEAGQLTPGSALETQSTDVLEWLRVIVSSGCDGLYEALIIISAAAGCRLPYDLVAVVGLSVMAGLGIVAGTEEFLTCCALKESCHAKVRLQKLEARAHLGREKLALADAWVRKGLDENAAISAVEAVSTNEEFFVQMKVFEEVGVPADLEEDGKTLLMCMLACVVQVSAGFIPLSVFIVKPLVGIEHESLSVIAFGLGLCCLFILSSLKSKFEARTWYSFSFQALVVAMSIGAMVYFLSSTLAEKCIRN
jgi:hypothetical protein